MSRSVYEWALVGGRNLFFFLISMNSKPFLSESLNFSRSLVIFCEFGELWEIHESGEIHEICEHWVTWRFHDHC